MQAASERQDFYPPAEPGRGTAFVLALLAHALLVGALAWGIHWKRDDLQLSAQAELWSATVQEAAPPLVEAPPPPPPPPPAPTPVVKAPPPEPVVKDADIALQREKKRKEEEKKRLEEKKAEEKKKKELAEKKRLEEEKKRELAEKQEKAEKAKKAEAAAKAKAAAEQAAKAKARDDADAKRVAQLREENLKRLQGLAGATGGATATGNALKSSGPSDTYAGRIRAKVKPNIVFTEDVPGNPVTEVEVRMAPDGTITSRKITRSSGVKAWDEAVLRALDRTEVLPRDTDGRVHSPLLMEFKPKG